MKPVLVLPFLANYDSVAWFIPRLERADDASLRYTRPVPASNSIPRTIWLMTTTAALPATTRLVGPGEQSENQKEEDADDLELESDEDPSKLRSARTRPGSEDGSTSARGGDGTINPPFP
jgi:hypothetical protein